MDYVDVDRQIRSALAAYALARREVELESDVEVRAVQRVVQSRVFDPGLTVGRVLKLTGLRDHNAQTRYHKATGETVWQYITRCRLEAATYLLEHTSAPVYLVGHAVGYKSCETFERRFKQLMGVCPTRFRQIRHPTQAEGHQHR